MPTLGLITFTPVAGFDLTISREELGFVVRAHKVAGTPDPEPEVIATRSHMRDARAAAAEWVEWLRGTVRNVARAWDQALAEDARRERFGNPNEVAQELHPGQSYRELPDEVVDAMMTRAREGLDRHVVAMPEADADAVSAALAGDQVVVLTSGPTDEEVDAALVEIAETRGLPRDSVRALYRGILDAFSEETGEEPEAGSFRIPPV